MKRVLTALVTCCFCVLMMAVPASAQESKTIEEKVQVLEESGYHFITAADLDASIDNMAGLGVYSVFEVAEIEDDLVKTSPTEGSLMFLVFHTVKDYTDRVKEGDLVAAYGIVEEPSSFLGASLTGVKESRIFALGEDAEKCDKGETDPIFAEYIVSPGSNTEETQSAELSEEEFKAQCQYVDYEDILRNPDNHKKEYAVVTGTVDQTIDGLLGLYTTLFIVDGNGNKWGCNISYSEGQSHILENDYVTVYGILDGTQTTETILGKQVTMPYVEIKYVG